MKKLVYYALCYIVFVILFLHLTVDTSSADTVDINRSLYSAQSIEVQNGTVFTVRLDYAISPKQEFLYLAEKLPGNWKVVEEWHDPFLDKDMSDFDINFSTGYMGLNSSTGEYEWVFADIYELWNITGSGVVNGYLTYDVYIPNNAAPGVYNINGSWKSSADVNNVVDMSARTYDYNLSENQNSTASSNVSVSNSDMAGPYIYGINLKELGIDSDTYIEAGEDVEISFYANDSSGIGNISVYMDGNQIYTNTSPQNNSRMNQVLNASNLSRGLHTVRIDANDSAAYHSYKEVTFFVHNDYLAWIDKKAITMMMAAHSLNVGDKKDGNWIQMEGGDPEIIPVINMNLLSLSGGIYPFPFTEQHIYTNVTGKNNVTARFEGAPGFKDQNITVFRIKEDPVTPLEMSFDKLLNTSLSDYNTERFQVKLDLNGDAVIYNNTTFDDGSYLILATKLDNPYNDTSALGVLAMTYIDVFRYRSNHSANNSSPVVGQKINVNISLENASQENYTYTAVLVKDDNYRSSTPGLEITFNENALYINGKTGFNYTSILTSLSLFNSTGTLTVNATNATLTLDTGPYWPTGEYRLVSNVYLNNSKAGHKYSIINLVPDITPPTAAVFPKSLTLDQYTTAFFNANNSTDNVGIASYSWDFDASNGISAEAAGITANHTFNDPGNFTVTLKVTDYAGKTDTDTAVVTVIDIPPVISGVGNLTPSNNSITIYWDTNETATSLVKYGTSCSNLDYSKNDPTMVLNHYAVLTNLLNNTTYCYNVSSNDSYGNTNQSGPFNFTTSDIPDNAPPVINGAYLSKKTNVNPGETLTVTVNVSDNIGTAAVAANSNNLSRLNFTHWRGNVTATAALKVFIEAYDGGGNSNNTTLSYTLYKKPASSGEGGGGGGGGTSGEEFENIICTETDRQFVGIDSPVSYKFELECNIVKYINFTGLTSSGKIAAKVEILDHRSSFVDRDPPQTVFRNLNVWVGNLGWYSEKNVGDPDITFFVEKSWVKQNNILPDTISMYRFNENRWDKMPTRMIQEDATRYYFTAGLFADFPGPMAISGNNGSVSEGHVPDNDTQVSTAMPGNETSPSKKPVTWTGIWDQRAPGMGIMAAVLAIFLSYSAIKESDSNDEGQNKSR